MSEFSVQSEGLDVERIMEQVRARIRANQEDDATDAQAGEQAAAGAARRPRPGGARPSAAGRPARGETAPAPSPTESFEFDQDTIYRSSRGAVGSALYGIRMVLSPLLKFFFNIQPVTHALAVQSRINAQQAAFDDRVARLFDMSSSRLAAREEIDKLNQQVMNDLVAEMTRLSVEMKNHRMLVESVAARLDFFERQARARESSAETRASRPAGETPAATESRTDGAEPARRRRRGRRRSGRGASAAAAGGAASGETAAGTADSPAPAEAADAGAATPPAAGATPGGGDSGETAAAASGETATAREDAQPAPAQPSASPEPDVKPADQ